MKKTYVLFFIKSFMMFSLCSGMENDTPETLCTKMRRYKYSKHSSSYEMEKESEKEEENNHGFMGLVYKAGSFLPSFSSTNKVDQHREVVLPNELWAMIEDFILPTVFKDGESLIESLQAINSFALTCRYHKFLADSSVPIIKKRISEVSDIDTFLEAISLLKKSSSYIVEAKDWKVKLRKPCKLSMPKELHDYLGKLLKNVQKMNDLINNGGLLPIKKAGQVAFELFDCGLRPDFVIHRYVGYEKYDNFLISYIYAPNSNQRVLRILNNHENISIDCINSLSFSAFFDLEEFKLKLNKELLVKLINKGLTPNFQFRVTNEVSAPLLAIAMKFSPQDLNLIKLLLDKGANPNREFIVSYELGKSRPLLIAQKKYPEVFNFFKEYRSKKS